MVRQPSLPPSSPPSGLTLHKLLVDGPPPLPSSLSPSLRFDTTLHKLLVNDPPPDLKHYITGSFIRVTTPFPEGKMVSTQKPQIINTRPPRVKHPTP